jgi:hypothetical protein
VRAKLGLIGPEECYVTGMSAVPCIVGKRKAAGCSDFGKVDDTKVKMASITTIIVGLGHMRESGNDLHNADVTYTIGGRKHCIESRNIERTVDFLEKGPED